MNPTIIACKTIERELLASMEAVGCSYPVLWLESGLHNWPDKLRGRIQELLDSCVGCDTVLLAMSLCGNAVVGLKTGDFRLVVPRCDDCIDLLLGSPERRRALPGTYFLTQGWLDGELNLWAEYQMALKKYGKKRGKSIFSAMLAHYNHLALLDTGCFDRKPLETPLLDMARELDLEPICLEGTLEYLQTLLTGPWDPDRFLVVPPNGELTSKYCVK